MLEDAKRLYGSFNHQERRIFSIWPSWPLQLCSIGFDCSSFTHVHAPFQFDLNGNQASKGALLRAPQSTQFCLETWKGSFSCSCKSQHCSSSYSTSGFSMWGIDGRKLEGKGRTENQEEVIWRKIMGNSEAEWRGEKNTYTLMVCSLQSMIKIPLTLIAHDQASHV